MRSFHAAQICDSQKSGKCQPESLVKDELVQAGSTREPNLVCASEDPQVLEKRYRSDVDAAAFQGDVDAQVCFIQGRFQLKSPADVVDYRARANAYINEAIERGDWRAVFLLATPMEAVAHGGAGALGTLKIIGKPFTIYQALELLKLGADAKYRTELGYRQEEVLRFLSKPEISNAKAWAASVYRKSFQNSPMVIHDPAVCQ